MDIASVLTKYDLDLTTVLQPEGLVRLGSAFSELLDTLSAETETQQNREKDVRDGLLSQYKSVAGESSLDVRDVIARIIQRMGDDILPALVEEVQSIKQDLMVLRDFHVSSVARENKPERVKDDAEIEIRKSEASTLREAILSVFTLMGRPTDIEGFKTKTNTAGEVVPDLPRVPGGNTSGNVGRGAKIRQMCWEVDGEKIPPGVLFYDVVRQHLCDFAEGEVIKPNEVKDLVDNSGQTFTAEGEENKWTVTVFSHTVSGWLPSEDGNK